MSPEYKARLVGLLREVVACYKSAGRGHAGLTDEKLDQAFLSAFGAYAGDRHDRGLCRALNDIGAENILRGRDEPIDKIPDELNNTVIPASVDDVVRDPPWVLFAFGWILWCPAIGYIWALARDEDEKDRQDRDDAEFRWFLGLSERPSERVINLDDARARRPARSRRHAAPEVA